jgi:TPP-dependent pyruvate/acetoin dehydrogenase alpha subunit
VAEKLATEDELALIQEEVAGQVKAAVAFARAAPQPALETLELHVHG